MTLSGKEVEDSKQEKIQVVNLYRTHRANVGEDLPELMGKYQIFLSEGSSIVGSMVIREETLIDLVARGQRVLKDK